MSEPDSQGIFVGDSYQVAGGHDVIPIHPNTINHARDWLTAALEQALEHARLGRVDANALLDGAERGEVLVLFVLKRATLEVKGVAAAELFDSVGAGRVAHLTALAGRDMDTWLGDFLAIGERLAQEQGAASITLLGRPAWREVLAPFGYNRVAVMLSKDLTETVP